MRKLKLVQFVITFIQSFIRRFLFLVFAKNLNVIQGFLLNNQKFPNNKFQTFEANQIECG